MAVRSKRSDPKNSATSLNATMAIKLLCKKYNCTLESARCMVNSKRRVVYVLSSGRITSSDCFEDDLLIGNSEEKAREGPKRKPKPAPKRKRNDMLQFDDLDLLASSASKALSTLNSPSSSKTTSPVSSLSKKAGIERPSPQQKRPVLTLVPDGFTVGFCAFQHAWLGCVRYFPDEKYESTDNEGQMKMVGMYMVTHVDSTGYANPEYESRYCNTPTRAFRQAFGKKFGDPADKRRPNGRLFFGFHYITMQTRLHKEFEHMYLGCAALRGQTIVPKTYDDQRVLFDRWCGELAMRVGLLPWLIHMPLVRNSFFSTPVSLETLLMVQLTMHGVQITIEDDGDVGDVERWSSCDVVSSITKCSCVVSSFPGLHPDAEGIRVNISTNGSSSDAVTYETFPSANAGPYRTGNNTLNLSSKTNIKPSSASETSTRHPKKSIQLGRNVPDQHMPEALLQWTSECFQ